MFRRRFAAALTSIAFGVAGALIAPVAAHADDSDYCNYDDTTFPQIHSYSPSTVTLGLESKLVTFRVSADDECGIDDWDINGPHVWAWDNDPTDRIYPWAELLCRREPRGRRGERSDYNTTTQRFGFRLLRDTYVSGFNVTPEPVKKGKYVTVKGTLKRADWDKGAYVKYGAKSQRVQVQFKAKGAASYTTVKTVTLGKKSEVKSKIKVAGSLAKDGTYRLSYAGNGISGASVSVGDYVDVK